MSSCKKKSKQIFLVCMIKFWRIFLNQLKFNTTAAFFRNWSILGVVFFNVVQHICTLKKTLSNLTNLKILNLKAAVASSFCLIGKIHHNFLVPKMIEEFNAYSDLESTKLIGELIYTCKMIQPGIFSRFS